MAAEFQYNGSPIKLQDGGLSDHPAHCIRPHCLCRDLTFETTDANAVVCARGVYRAGCAGYRGAAVVARPPTVICRTVQVNGVRVRRRG
jgi:hypothetical protein